MDYNQDNNYHLKFFITQLFQLIEDVSTRNANNNDDPIMTYKMFCFTKYAILVPTQLKTIFKYHNTQTLYPSSFAYPNHISRIPLYEHVTRDYAYILQRATKNTHRSPKRVCLLTCFFFRLLIPSCDASMNVVVVTSQKRKNALLTTNSY